MAAHASYGRSATLSHEDIARIWTDYDAQIKILDEIAFALIPPEETKGDFELTEEPVIPDGTAEKIKAVGARAVGFLKEVAPHSKKVQNNFQVIIDSANNDKISKGRIQALIGLLNTSKTLAQHDIAAPPAAAAPPAPVPKFNPGLTCGVTSRDMESEGRLLYQLDKMTDAQIWDEFDEEINVLEAIASKIPPRTPATAIPASIIRQIEEKAGAASLAIELVDSSFLDRTGKLNLENHLIKIATCIKDTEIPLRTKVKSLIFLLREGRSLTTPPLAHIPPAPTAAAGPAAPIHVPAAAAAAVAAPAAPSDSAATPLTPIVTRILAAEALVNNIFRRQAALPPHDPDLLAKLMEELKAAEAAEMAAMFAGRFDPMAKDSLVQNIYARINALPRDPVLVAELEAELKAACEVLEAAYAEERKGKPHEMLPWICTGWSMPSPEARYWTEPNGRWARPDVHLSFDSSHNVKVEIGAHYLWIKLANKEDGKMGAFVCCDSSLTYMKKSFTIQYRFMLKNRAGENVCIKEWSRCTFSPQGQAWGHAEFTTMAEAITKEVYDPRFSRKVAGDDYVADRDILFVACEIVAVSDPEL